MRTIEITDFNGTVRGYIKYARIYDSQHAFVGRISGSDAIDRSENIVGHISCLKIFNVHNEVVGHVHGPNIYDAARKIVGKCRTSTLIGGAALLLLLPK